MTKFIPCQDGAYVNLDKIHSFMVNQYGHEFSVKILYDDFDGGAPQHIITKFDSAKEAQEWLDKFMEKHGLCI
jgi:hypothetical protein